MWERWIGFSTRWVVITAGQSHSGSCPHTNLPPGEWHTPPALNSCWTTDQIIKWISLLHFLWLWGPSHRSRVGVGKQFTVSNKYVTATDSSRAAQLQPQGWRESIFKSLFTILFLLQALRVNLVKPWLKQWHSAVICSLGVILRLTRDAWLTTLHKRQSILINNYSVKARTPGCRTSRAQLNKHGNDLYLIII